MIGIHRSIPEPCMFGSMFHSFVESTQTQPTESRGRKSLYPHTLSCALNDNDFDQTIDDIATWQPTNILGEVSLDGRVIAVVVVGWTPSGYSCVHRANWQSVRVLVMTRPNFNDPFLRVVEAVCYPELLGKRAANILDGRTIACPLADKNDVTDGTVRPDLFLS
jgi:hypothetical protein